MFTDPLNWFPSILFSNLLAVLFFGGYIADHLVPKLAGAPPRTNQGLSRDKSSFGVIQVAGILAAVVAFVCRYLGWIVLPAWAQWFGLALGAFGICYREWAVVTLGRFFSRVVEIEPGQRLITSGPYRHIRHPAYTGMILFYVGFALALGSGAGVVTSTLIIFTATAYRIKIEELALREAFGTEYEEYIQRTWKLVPGW